MSSRNSILTHPTDLVVKDLVVKDANPCSVTMNHPKLHRMREAVVSVHGAEAGRLMEQEDGQYMFIYFNDYDGPPASLTMPVRPEPYPFERFPPFFDGLLPEGWQLEALLRQAKLDRGDVFGQLLAVGADTVGAVTVEAASVRDAENMGTEP